MATESIHEYLRGEMEAWAAEFVQDRIAALRKKKISASGNLARSLEAEVRGQAVDAALQALIYFEEYGRFVDMKTLQPPPAGADYIQELITWMQRKGLAEKFTRSYVRRRGLKKPPERVLTYLAFGMARKRNKGKYRRRRWYNQGKRAKIAELYNDVQANMPETIAAEIKQSLAQRG